MPSYSGGYSGGYGGGGYGAHHYHKRSIDDNDAEEAEVGIGGEAEVGIGGEAEGWRGSR